MVAALGVSRDGLDYEAPDGAPVHLVFLILASPNATPAYLSVLGRTARIFHREEVRQEVLAAEGTGVPLPGFGSSDCRHCPAHLARVPHDFDHGRFNAA